jgi:hypothetical protein
MLKLSVRGVLALVALSSVLLLDACSSGSNPLATINYSQIGACSDFSHDGLFTSAGPNQAYVIFRISTIANQEAGAKNFDFDPSLLFINGGTVRDFGDDTNLAAINPFIARPATVMAGTTLTFNGDVVIIVQTVASDPTREVEKTNYLLDYSTPTNSEGALPVKANVNAHTFPFTPNCEDVTY